MGDGGYNIHGHCHRNLKEDGTIKRLDVGWDWKKRPVEWNEIVRELKSNKFSPVDHHGADTSSFFE
jgi:calcineurin-like phosphoesterase family protein